ncbi:MAG TPA: hypothetical protein VMT80_00235 [Candidatus Paceibacterota bacterium]|nr:hypothetical protein [Candidatus Paceibacterota bacterium]
MAFEQYKTNVQALCAKRGIGNPIQEHDLQIAAVGFRDNMAGTVWVHQTEMNRAGRLFVEELLAERRKQQQSLQNILPVALEPLRAKIRDFFTDELWNDSGPDKRTLVFHLKTADTIARVQYK